MSSNLNNLVKPSNVLPFTICKKLGGYNRFIVAWDRGFLTRRALSYLRTVVEWLNHYETLKKYEIDHKKSCGAYAWTFVFEDVKAFDKVNSPM